MGNRGLPQFVEKLHADQKSLMDGFTDSAGQAGFSAECQSHRDLWQRLAAEMHAGILDCLRLQPGNGLDHETFAQGAPETALLFKMAGYRLDRFLLLIKQCREPFIDMAYGSGLTVDDTRTALAAVDLYSTAYGALSATAWLEDDSSTYQKKLREARLYALQEKKRYATIFYGITEPAFVFDQHLRIVDVNAAFEKFFGLAAAKQIGRSCGDVLGRDVCRRCGIEQMMRERVSFANLEFDVVVRGRRRTVLLCGSPLGDVSGECPSGIVILHDITDQKRAEMVLRESEEMFRTLVENVPDVTWRADLEGYFHFVSPNAEKLTGFSADDLCLRSRFARIHPDDLAFVRDEYGRLFSELKEFDVRYRFLHADGRWIWLHDRAETVYESCGLQYADGVFSDITRLQELEEELEEYQCWLEDLVDERTEELREVNEKLQREIAERRHAEEELTQLTARLKRSNTELEQFAHIASHDLKEPLLLINAFGERLQSRYRQALNDTGQQYLDRIMKAARKLQRLIDDLLELSRISTSDRPFEKFDLAELVREVVDDLQESISRVGGTIKIGAMHHLTADRVQVRQLLQNIFSNALKYRKENEPPVVTIESRILDNGFCEISVADNGIGFDEQDLGRIFHPFERLRGSDRYEGTGIGLTTCQRIVVRHGGEITARSAPGRGSTFIVRLPAGSKTREKGNRKE